MKRRKYSLTEAYLVFPFEAFACRCCGFLRVHPLMVMGFYHLSQLVDPKLIVVHSGYRCLLHNEKVGGSPTSWHPRGGALDYHIIGYTLRDMYEIAKRIREFRGIGVYEEWNNPGLHCDVRDYDAEWEQVGGVYRKGITWEA